MQTLRNLLLTVCLLGIAMKTNAATPRHSLADDQPNFAGLAIDQSGQFVDMDPVHKSDPRDNLALYGQRPTLLLVSVHPSWKADEIKEYVKTVKRVDKLAAKWERAGFDVLCVMPQAWMEQKGKRIALDLVDRAKPSHMSCALRADRDLHSLFEQPVKGDLLAIRYGSELSFRWALIEELGVVRASGSDVFDKSLETRLESIELPALCKNSTTERIFDAINEWRLGDAEEQLAKLEAGVAADRFESEIAELRERITKAEQHFRKVFCAPYQDRKMLADHVDQLDRLAAMFGTESANGDRLRAESQALRQSENYAAAVRQRERYRAMIQLADDLEAAVDREYEARMGKRADYDEAQYYAAVLELYPAAIEQLNLYVKEERESPYYKVVAMILMDVNEELAYARESQ